MKEENQARIGVDESGKGDYFGYLVVAAVYVDDSTESDLKKLGVRDSKKIVDRKIIDMDKKIRKLCKHDIVKISPEKYNELYKRFKSLNKLLAWGHARAIENMLKKSNCTLVITDKFGEERFLKDTLFEKGKKVTIIQRIRAEDDTAVAAASIIARAEFLKTLRQLGREAGFVLPKGASHEVDKTGMQIIEKYGSDNGMYVLNKIAKMHFKNTGKIIKKDKQG